MRDLPPFGQELAEAQQRLDEVLARCAIRLKTLGVVAGANDNFLFPGKSAPDSGNASGDAESAPHNSTG